MRPARLATRTVREARGDTRRRAGRPRGVGAVMAFYEVLVQRPWGGPRVGARVRLADDRVESVEGETDRDGRVVIECRARVV